MCKYAFPAGGNRVTKVVVRMVETRVGVEGRGGGVGQMSLRGGEGEEGHRSRFALGRRGCSWHLGLPQTLAPRPVNACNAFGLGQQALIGCVASGLPRGLPQDDLS